MLPVNAPAPGGILAHAAHPGPPLDWMTTTDAPLLAALRAATAEAHRAIDDLLQLDRLADLARYRRVLSGFASFLVPWEPRVRERLAAAGSGDPDALLAWFDARSRLPMLRQDLAALGLSGPDGATLADTPADADAHSPRPWLPNLPDAPAAWGSLYVLEGSALGGQVIARHVGPALGLAADHGAAYFHGHGRATGAMWADFRQRLSQAVPPGAAATASACSAAVATFSALQAHFECALATPA